MEDAEADVICRIRPLWPTGAKDTGRLSCKPHQTKNRNDGAEGWREGGLPLPLNFFNPMPIPLLGPLPLDAPPINTEPRVAICPG